MDPEPTARLRSARALLHTAGDLAALGMTRRSLERGLRSGEWLRVQRGWFIRASAWRGLFPEDRHLLHVLAVHSRSQLRPIFSHYSAAVLHGLPLFRLPSVPVHVTCVPPGRSNSTRSVVRRVARLRDEDVQRVGELVCTSVTRTLLDLARNGQAATAAACADAALRKYASSPAGALKLRDEVLELMRQQPRARGNVQARRILSLADGRADSVLESVSRLYLHELGFDVRLQVEVPSPNGRAYRVDFEFVGLGVFGEVDGQTKYLDPELRNSRTAEDVVLAEKKREDWIRGTTGKRVVRWDASHLVSAAALGERLRAFGVFPPLRRR